MRRSEWLGLTISGAAAGIVNGLFGAGGGMVLIPLLCLFSCVDEAEIFPASVSIILPICLVTLTATAIAGPLPWRDSIPYLIGSTVGGVLAGFLGKKIPVELLHKALGLLIIWGGVRYLW